MYIEVYIMGYTYQLFVISSGIYKAREILFKSRPFALLPRHEATDFLDQIQQNSFYTFLTLISIL